MFVYSGYWRTWSRELKADNSRDIDWAIGPYIEVNLTPIPSSTRTWENDVAPIIIRAHSTRRNLNPDHGDLYVRHLPLEVIAEMKDNLSPSIMGRLLYEDFLPQIDWVKYRAVRNGGAALADITPPTLPEPGDICFVRGPSRYVAAKVMVMENCDSTEKHFVWLMERNPTNALQEASVVRTTAKKQLEAVVGCFTHIAYGQLGRISR